MDIDFSKYSSDCVDFLQKLIKIPSVNGQDNEKAIVSEIANEAKKLGLPHQLIIKDAFHPNVFIGDDFKSNQELLLVAHTDTVGIGDKTKWEKDPFSGIIQNNKIFGRGAIDCKGGIALNLYVYKILSDLGKPHLVKVVAVADEEIAGDSDFGLRYMLSNGLNAKAAIYTYGGNSDHTSINIGHRGVVRLWITCHGEGAHSGSREWQDRLKGDNAIEGIVDFLNKLKEFKFVETNKFFPGYKTIITPTLIEGGSGESLVPDIAKILLDIRLLPDTNPKDLIKKITQITQDLTSTKRSFEISIKNNIPAALSDPTDPFIKTVSDLNREIFGVDPVIKGSGPINESYMLIERGIPTIAGFGPSGDNFHAPNEYALIDSIETSLKFLTKVVLNLQP